MLELAGSGAQVLAQEGAYTHIMMPSKEILIGRLLGMLTYPMRGLAVALSEVAKKKEATV